MSLQEEHETLKGCFGFTLIGCAVMTTVLITIGVIFGCSGCYHLIARKEGHNNGGAAAVAEP
jgi:hypothetical protein